MISTTSIQLSNDDMYLAVFPFPSVQTKSNNTNNYSRPEHMHKMHSISIMLAKHDNNILFKGIKYPDIK